MGDESGGVQVTKRWNMEWVAGHRVRVLGRQAPTLRAEVAARAAEYDRRRKRRSWERVRLVPADMQPAVQRMTNWQRNRWARSGYSWVPGFVGG